MQKRKLGTNGPEVSAIGYGAMGFHLAYGAADEEAGRPSSMAWGENEKFIGRAVKGFRDDVVLATKFGFTRSFCVDSRPQLPGSRKAERVAENVGAADLVLTAADLAKIKEILPEGGFGERYAEGFAPTCI